MSTSNLTLHRYKRTGKGYNEALGNGVELALMLIPAGEFMMGAAEDETDSRDDERPLHLVKVPQFLMGRYPVTQAQWKAVAEYEQVERKLDPDPSRFKGDNRPVEQVSWYEAVEFCKRLSSRTGREYGLPSEAEWEYACRAETETPFHFGKIITVEVANFFSSDSKREYKGETTPIDYFGIANAFGLCDMHGNVLEWCQDQWHDNYEQAPTDGSAWLSSDESASSVLRGGSWYHSPGYCRSASRSYYAPVNRHFSIGFRVVCHAP
ncbi:formylglycine-generating enzyme family protein [Leptolyngbya cf. ectocarpi LEGE 11479]|uniref:Formylglycine-generating enzyme family protein n=1 Tax=Leptolyngbya cf. ectocarpi LEGE 11479 TaxID=1828722 RepID=A0A928X1I2_LEPEC|nr:formylglycine-generating enzyme family protein [Leptolyngbya ectocarpi]MBE9065283.1 formylglycine-generating enzyme family protein [Leptolyngbya cf. ectocarpi LEGE 11479]